MRGGSSRTPPLLMAVVMCMKEARGSSDKDKAGV
jgi:hypothetical protein